MTLHHNPDSKQGFYYGVIFFFLLLLPLLNNLNGKEDRQEKKIRDHSPTLHMPPSYFKKIFKNIWYWNKLKVK